jgi:hypothetical protein
MSFEPEIGDVIHLEDSGYNLDEIVLVLKKTKQNNTHLILRVFVLKASPKSFHFEGLCDLWGFIRNDMRFKLIGRLNESV